jgi:hypothetical protein
MYTYNVEQQKNFIGRLEEYFETHSK